MKAIVLAVGLVVLVIGALLLTLVFKAAGAFSKAHGQALYSSAGAWKRIDEFAHTTGNSNYIAEADSTLKRLEGDLKAWRQSASSGTDFAALEKLRTTAYETTDRNIKNGLNPLAHLDQQTVGSGAQSGSQKTPGMSEFDYLACDGGPHLVLPKELSQQWKGGGSIVGVLNPLSDYRRACAAITNGYMALISVGNGQAMVLREPPLSSWGRSPEGWVDIYYLESWPDTNTDAVIKRAVAGTPTSAMADTGKSMALTKPGLILLFAGDKPGSTAYGEVAIPIDPGSYRILEGHYKAPTTIEEIYIYRFQPKKGL